VEVAVPKDVGRRYVEAATPLGGERFMLGSERDLSAGDTRGSLAGPRTPRSPGGTVDPWS